MSLNSLPAQNNATPNYSLVCKALHVITLILMIFKPQHWLVPQGGRQFNVQEIMFGSQVIKIQQSASVEQRHVGNEQLLENFIKTSLQKNIFTFLQSKGCWIKIWHLNWTDNVYIHRYVCLDRTPQTDVSHFCLPVQIVLAASGRAVSRNHLLSPCLLLSAFS